jgi:cytochrome c553
MVACSEEVPAVGGESESVELTAEELDFFESKIRPVLVAHCYECHATESKIVRGGLWLDTREGIREGGDTGPAVVPGDVESSWIIGALRHESFEMPPDNRLPDDVIADFVTWIERGAPDPRERGEAGGLPQVDYESARTHWAFRPIDDPALPDVVDEEWVKMPLDRFILARLEQEGIAPAAEADKRTLIRRATLDLTGLPPTREEVQQFLADEEPGSYARLIDRLLDSPHYGERWGRHWLDLVRYADTNGADENHAMPEAWRYRDWVIRMLNQDLPLDQFLVQQLAGDLLPVPDDEQAAGDLLTATGLLVVGPKMLAEQDKDKMIIDIVDEQIDTVTRTMLGMTVACARCHDHKFDPISAQDYYALAGIFASTRTMANREFVSKWMERPLPSAEMDRQREEHEQKLAEARRQLMESSDSLTEMERKQQEEQIEKLEKEMPLHEMVMAVSEGEPTNLPVHIRGNHLTLAEQATPRGTPQILTDVAPLPEISDEASGRLELAQWLVAEEQPLTRRVLANRIWLWHFGQGLVRSPSNFGLQGEEPTHPELLDWLAQQLARHGWSLKEMHRQIMLSATYRMSSTSNMEAEARDPENRLWWRQNRRRLEAEAIRDSILMAGGSLDRALGGKVPSVDAVRRSVYLPINRSAHYEMFSTFDYVETANHIEQRPTTTVPHQALFLLNSPMVHEQAEKVAAQVLAEEVLAEEEGVEERLEILFEHLYGRLPNRAERERAEAFLAEAASLLASTLEADSTTKDDSPADDSSSPTDRLETAAWASLCRTLMAANEFVYLD